MFDVSARMGRSAQRPSRRVLVFRDVCVVWSEVMLAGAEVETTDRRFAAVFDS